MESGVNYDIKHSGEFLYKLSNEEDKSTYKVTLFLFFYFPI